MKLIVKRLHYGFLKEGVSHQNVKPTDVETTTDLLQAAVTDDDGMYVSIIDCKLNDQTKAELKKKFKWIKARARADFPGRLDTRKVQVTYVYGGNVRR